MAQYMIYSGIDKDVHSGMTDVGKLIRNAWMFGIIAETSRCEGWNYAQIENLYANVHEACAPYGHLVSRLPGDFRERHEATYAETIAQARAASWNIELDEND